MNDASFLPKVGDQAEVEAGLNEAVVKSEAFSIVQGWFANGVPTGTIERFLDRAEGSAWLKANMAELTYEKLEELAEKNYQSNISTEELRRAQLAEEMLRYINKVLFPIVAVDMLRETVAPEDAERFGLWMQKMLVGTNQNDVSDMISVAEAYCPALILNSHREYWQEEGDPEDSHRTEKATGPLLAASLTLGMGEKGEIFISDYEENRGGLGHTTSAFVSFK
ncbi:MAG: hypothetical protein UT02_C0012G0032 [Parcubacteria group bacterium GW2011_GWC2_38_7]|nr:MAG: hypothetical protein UT02_C0012G0032 [Parcubacteria group bacterium GW2011_GWC2_38_7]